MSYYNFKKLNSIFDVEGPDEVWYNDSPEDNIKGVNWKPEMIEYFREIKLGELNSFYGRKHTEETKEKMRDNFPCRKGKNNTNYGIKKSSECKEVIRQKKCKYLYRFTMPDGKQFVSASIKQVSDQYGLKHNMMYAVKNGKQNHHKQWRVEVYDE